MNCERFKEMILDSVVDGYDPEKNTDFQTHILICAECRLEYEQTKSAVRILKPEPGEGLNPIEKLKIENRIYEARLRRFASGNYRVINLKRLTAIAAALFFFFLGFFIRSFFPVSPSPDEIVSREKRIEELLDLRLLDVSGQRFSSRGFLVMKKGIQAFLEGESEKQSP
jgi:hypothetical protein